MALELLIAETQGLSEEALMEVVRFVRFIKEEARRTVSADEQSIVREAGKYRGKIVMADDFDAPLDGFKEQLRCPKCKGTTITVQIVDTGSEIKTCIAEGQQWHHLTA